MKYIVLSQMLKMGLKIYIFGLKDNFSLEEETFLSVLSDWIIENVLRKKIN